MGMQCKHACHPFCTSPGGGGIIGGFGGKTMAEKSPFEMGHIENQEILQEVNMCGNHHQPRWCWELDHA